MPTITYEGETYDAEPGQTVLDVLLGAGVDLPYSCRKGICLSCVVKCSSGDIPEGCQKGLKPTLVSERYLLACMATATSDMELASSDDALLYNRASVKEIEELGGEVYRLLLRPATPIYYHAGQFLNLRRPDGLVRSYSLASVPFLDSALEFHIKRMTRGRMSNWIIDDLKVGDSLDLQGPNGACFYVAGKAEQPMLLIGAGSGLAPLYGIARDALFSSHSGEIHFYHGSRTVDGLYYQDRLKDMAGQYDNFFYHPCVTKDAAPDGVREMRANEAAFADFSDLTDWRVFLCGLPDMVNEARQNAYLMGAAMADILVDAYEYRDLRETERGEDDQAGSGV